MKPVTGPALCHADDSCLVVVDIQTRLAAAMAREDRERLLKNTTVLLRAAATLNIPVLATEQYPAGLGPTDAALQQHIPQDKPPLAKTAFSCCQAQGFMEKLELHGRRQVILCGMESHVCILQTALELQHTGRQVFVAEDAVCSRDPARHANALVRLRQAGIFISNMESVVFEWLRDAGHEHFKTLSALLR